MDRFEAMRILLAAIDTGSLSAASRQLQTSLPTVSRRVAELEEHMGVRLLLRGTRKLELTDAGRAFVVSCRRIVEDVALARLGQLLAVVFEGVLTEAVEGDTTQEARRDDAIGVDVVAVQRDAGALDQGALTV